MLKTQIVKWYFVVDWGVYDIPTSGGEDLDESSLHQEALDFHRRKLDLRQ